MILNTLLTAMHALMLAVIFIIVFSYQPDVETRYRAGVSLLATMLAGGSLASLVHIVTQWGESCPQSPPGQVLLTLVVLIAVVRTRGNVAKLLPRLKWNKPI